ncbi:MAG TPA: ATP-binding protein [Thermomicrobiales bacterium]|nr:ATP-binding protein [Thermomicrobiales bacterium]
MNLSAETDLRSRIASRTNNLQFRIGAPFILLVTLVFAIFLVVATVVVDRVYIDRLSAQLESQAEIVALAVTDARARGDDHDEIVEFLEQSAALADNRMTLIGADGQVLADTGAEESGMDNHGTRPEVLEARERGVGQAKRDSETLDEPFLYVAVAVPDIEGSVLRLAVPVTDVDQAIDAMQRIVLAAILVVLALTLLAAWFTGRRLARPLSELQETANAVAAGNFTARAEPSDVSEIAVVGQAFNSMAERLHAVIEADRHTNARLEAIMAGLVDGVVLTDGEGNILRMNEAASRMLDADIETAIGRPFVQVSRDHEIWIVLRDALRGKKKPSATVEHGIERMSLLVTARALQEDGELLGLMVLRDVSELRRLELVRREFVSNVSHELRTPLTSIRALVETLEAGALDEPDLAQDFLSRIIGEVDRLNALVEDLLDFARLEAGRVPLNLQPVDIGEAIRIGADRLRPQIERARLDLHIDIAPDLPEIEVDTKRIEQVMINLVHNAIKFTPPDGAITVRVYQRKGNIVTEVQDTGVGIPHDEQARLFERFYKSDKARRSEGTGLGLAIAKNIVLLHGGKIEVESEPGEGAIFRFMLPIARKKAMKRARKHALGLR